MNDDNPLSSLSASQRSAFLDLLVLAMYVDGHLATVEDTNLKRILGAMGFATKYDRDREFDAAVTRVRPYVGNAESARQHAVRLAAQFGTDAERDCVAGGLAEFMVCDAEISPSESRLLATVRELFAH